jgi:hypothetical protein
MNIERPTMFIFFSIIGLFLHIFPFDVSRLGVIGRSMFDVHLFQ